MTYMLLDQAARRAARGATFAAALLLVAETAAAQETPILLAQSSQPAFTYDLLVHQLLINDPVAFAMQHEKQLKVTKAQRDSLRQFERALRQQRSPILRDAERQLSVPAPATARLFDPLALPPRVQDGYRDMLQATLAFEPRVTALLDSVQRATLVELRAAWTPPQAKAAERKVPFVIREVRGRPPM